MASHDREVRVVTPDDERTVRCDITINTLGRPMTRRQVKRYERVVDELGDAWQRGMVEVMLEDVRERLRLDRERQP